ncbi:hypothetical protein [Anaerostipes sp.]|nr:hypothetical protein [Anaerostipes sp.]MCI5622681.1 hypothetical protein [Anaerostipes sp.]
MKRVWGIAFFFFGIGLLTGFFINQEFTRVMVCLVSWMFGYCLFFH